VEPSVTRNFTAWSRVAKPTTSAFEQQEGRHIMIICHNGLEFEEFINSARQGPEHLVRPSNDNATRSPTQRPMDANITSSLCFTLCFIALISMLASVNHLRDRRLLILLELCTERRHAHQRRDIHCVENHCAGLVGDILPSSETLTNFQRPSLILCPI